MTRIRTRVLTALSEAELLWLDDALVTWDDAGTLTHVGAYDSGPYDEDLRDGVLTPGFVDSHIHFPQTRIVGAASGPLLPWLLTSTFPEETRFADAAHAQQVAAAFTRSLLAAGTTLSFVYSSVHTVAAHALFDALDRAGLRAIAGPVLMDDGGPPELMVPVEAALDGLQELRERWQGERLQLAVIPRFGLSCTTEMMTRAGRFADAHGLWVSTHLSENLDECAATRERFGTEDYLQVYEDAGLLHGRSVYAHCIHLSDSEWDRFARARAVVAHCPDSNDFLGSGGMPLSAVEDRGIRLTLGTDVAAGRTFRVPRVASSAHDNALRQGTRVDPVRWLWAATRGGALALEQSHTGALQQGLAADCVLHELPPWVESGTEALGWLLFHHDAPPVRRTWVAGRPVWSRDQHHSGPWMPLHR